MSGHNVPYQLRPNKFVERQLFLDILDFVRIWNGPSKYLYASMGGRFLEDFRLVNHRFAIEQMISIEKDATTCNRQQFNRLGFIDCRNQSTGEFVDDVERVTGLYPGRRLVVWLDFATANERGEQLGEFRELITKLAVGDVAKITLNANPQSFRKRSAPITRRDFDFFLRDPESPTHKDYETYLLEIVATHTDPASGTGRPLSLSDEEYEAICIANLKMQLGEYMPTEAVASDDLSLDRFACLLAGAVKMAALKGVEGIMRQVIPLGAYRYRDGEHQMLTVTCMIADEELVAMVSGDAVFASWAYRAMDWTDVKEVNVPDISSKEKHLIESYISEHKDAVTIHSTIPFRLDDNETRSLAMLTSFIDHYRRYPSFVRIH